MFNLSPCIICFISVTDATDFPGALLVDILLTVGDPIPYADQVTVQSNQ